MQKIKFDFLFTAILITIIGIGISFIFSAGSIFGMNVLGDPYHFVKKQFTYLVVGLVPFFLAAKIPYQKIRKMLPWINIGALTLMLMPFVPGLGSEVNGAERWVKLGFFSFQPSEVVKVVMILTIASMIDVRLKQGKLNKLSFDGLFSIVAYLGVIVMMFLIQKHLSATGVILFIAMVILVVGGLSKRYITLSVLAVSAVAVVGVIIEPFRMKRIFGFLDPEKNPLGDGYHIMQSWYGLGSGEFFGLGLGMSRQKFGWLPENHTDFIMAIIGEEIGFLGVTLVISLFVLLILRCLWVAYSAPDTYGMLIVVGVTAMLFFQSIINFAVVAGLFPVTGMPLPFISYGGTSLIVLMTAMGLVYNVISQSKIED